MFMILNYCFSHACINKRLFRGRKYILLLKSKNGEMSIELTQIQTTGNHASVYLAH